MLSASQEVRSVMQTPEELRQIALSVKAKDKYKVQVEQLDFSDLEDNINRLEGFIKQYAESGKLELRYDFTKTKHSMYFIHQNAELFKSKNPGFMVIVSEGQRSIFVDWSGKHQV